MKIYHKLVASFVGVSLFRIVVGTVAIADNGCAIPETVRSHPMPSGVLSGESHFFTQHGLNLSYPLTELFFPILHSFFINFIESSERKIFSGVLKELKFC
ncbi:MAG: hypothetical protein V7K77_28940 [Nostoc sp.]|uniref:hypothetical protein n=1 Tax=Nostoc sp. TaxID=1180 RepID=UPI002FF4BE02